MKILVAGIGNILHGDDAFGCEVIRELIGMGLPMQVTAADFGIRGYDLAYALADGYDLSILVEAVPAQKTPGTVYLIEPDLNRLSEMAPVTVDSHSLNPIAVLQMAQSVGALRNKLFLVGCEPTTPRSPEPEIGLSEPVRNAVPEALRMIQSLIADALKRNRRALDLVLA